jgi:hypothetical protein
MRGIKFAASEGDSQAGGGDPEAGLGLGHPGQSSGTGQGDDDPDIRPEFEELIKRSLELANWIERTFGPLARSGRGPLLIPTDTARIRR